MNLLISTSSIYKEVTCRGQKMFHGKLFLSALLVLNLTQNALKISYDCVDYYFYAVLTLSLCFMIHLQEL